MLWKKNMVFFGVHFLRVFKISIFLKMSLLFVHFFCAGSNDNVCMVHFCRGGFRCL